MVMKDGRAVEHGLTDQVLDDPHHPYTQLLVSSVLQA
jgi:putative phosphonate transport system ATP-binding protein